MVIRLHTANNGYGSPPPTYGAPAFGYPSAPSPQGYAAPTAPSYSTPGQAAGAAAGQAATKAIGGPAGAAVGSTVGSMTGVPQSGAPMQPGYGTPVPPGYGTHRCNRAMEAISNRVTGRPIPPRPGVTRQGNPILDLPRNFGISPPRHTRVRSRGEIECGDVGPSDHRQNRRAGATMSGRTAIRLIYNKDAEENQAPLDNPVAVRRQYDSMVPAGSPLAPRSGLRRAIQIAIWLPGFLVLCVVDALWCQMRRRPNTAARQRWLFRRSRAITQMRSERRSGTRIGPDPRSGLFL